MNFYYSAKKKKVWISINQYIFFNFSPDIAEWLEEKFIMTLTLLYGQVGTSVIWASKKRNLPRHIFRNRKCHINAQQLLTSNCCTPNGYVLEYPTKEKPKNLCLRSCARYYQKWLNSSFSMDFNIFLVYVTNC